MPRRLHLLDETHLDREARAGEEARARGLTSDGGVCVGGGGVGRVAATRKIAEKLRAAGERGRQE